MAGKRYSAGAIFLQVVPVFANVQKAIEDEAKNIDRALGDRMEKSGQKAGERAGKAASKSMNDELAKGSGEFEREMHKSIDGINKALGGIDTKRLSNGLRKELTAVKRELNSLKDLDLAVDGDFRKFNQGIAEAEGRVRGLRDNAKIIFRADIDNALKGFAKVEAAKEKIEDPIEIEVSTDFKVAERKMGAFEQSIKRTMDKAARHMDGSMNKQVRRLRDELDYLSKLRVGVDIGANQLKREVSEISAELEKLSQETPDIDVKFDAGRAWAELGAFDAAVEKLDGKDIDVKAKVDSSQAEAGFFRLSRGGDQAANSFRSFNIILLAAAGAGPALIPILGAIAGGLFAIGPAAAVAGAGLASVFIGFSGIGDAVQALQAKEDQAAMTAQTAAKQQVSSANAVANARRSAAAAVESALDRQANAQKAYADSIQDVKDAEQALAEARAAARGTGADIKEKISDNKLAQDQALLDVFNQTVAYDSTMADGSATNAEKEQARIDLEQARDRLSDLRKEAKELAKEQKKWREEGVNGTEEVQTAQDHLNDALDAQREAYQNLGDAAKAVDQARADGARQVADAMRQQGDAMDNLTAQQNAVDQAFNKLGPAGQKFALFIQGLKDEFYSFRDDIQTVMLPQIQTALESFFGSKSGKILREALIGLADSFGQFAVALSASFQGEAWTAFFTMLRDLGPDIQKAYGQAFISFMEAMASILTALAPMALLFAEGLANMMAAFADWAKSKKGQEQIQGFMDYAERVGPKVLDFLWALVGAVANLLVGMAKWGEMTLGGFTSFLEMIANMDPKLLAAIATSLVILITSSQTAYAAMNLMNAGMALLLNPIGLVIFALVGIAAALAYLYVHNEKFRKFVQKAWAEVSAAVMKAWEDSIKPALESLWGALDNLWKNVLVPFFTWLGPILLWLAKTLIPLFGMVFGFWINNIARLINWIIVPAFRLLGWALKGTWEHVLRPTIHGIAWAAKWLWENQLKPFWNQMGNAWDDLMTGMVWVWEHILRPAWDYIRNTALPALERAFRTTIDVISDMWDALQTTFATPIDFLLDGVINNGVIDGYNTVAGWVHADKLDHIPVPKYIQKHSAFADGGVLPGYTPGRDPHKFVSPTGGRLELSGGEAILRPEFTAAVGPQMINYWNSLAKRKGVSGVRDAVMGGSQAFAKGGIFFPLPGGSLSTYPGHDGVDINAPGDLGRPFYSATSGYVTTTGYSRGYGNAVFVQSPYGELVYGHALDGSIRVNRGQHVNPGTMLAQVGSTGNSSGPHLHFGFPGGSYAAAAALLHGVDPGKQTDWQGMAKPAHRAIPDWMMSLVKNPLATVKGWVTKPVEKASSRFKDNKLFDLVTKVPLLAVEKMTDKVWDIVPGWVKNAAGWAGDAKDWVVGGVKNAGEKIGDVAGGAAGAVKDGAGAVKDFVFADGGILPYNGTMMYDNGGYLPPGLTTVMNLTGKPEPVFTNDQWQDMSGGVAGGNIHYEPHFEGSDLTAADVAGDLNFTFRQIKRSGKYAGVGDQ